MVPPFHCLLAGQGFLDAVCVLVMDNCVDLFRSVSSYLPLMCCIEYRYW